MILPLTIKSSVQVILLIIIKGGSNKPYSALSKFLSESISCFVTKFELISYIAIITRMGGNSHAYIIPVFKRNVFNISPF